MDVFTKAATSRLRDLYRRGRKTLRAKGDKWLQPTRVFQTQQNWCTYELTVTVAAHTRSAHVQVRWGPSTERRKEHKVPPQPRRYLHAIPSGKVSVPCSVVSLSRSTFQGNLCPGVLGQHNFFFFVLLVIVFLFWLSFRILLFGELRGKREKQGWVGSEVERF